MAGKGDDSDHSNSENQYDYESDCRTACKYGVDCFQRNPLHQKKFKHPPKRRAEDEVNGVFKKKVKVNEEVEEETKDNEETKDDIKDTEETTVQDDSNDNDEDLSPQEKIKKGFLVEMPQDFYSFWEFCQSVKISTLKTYLGLIPLGPFDVLSGKFKSNLKPSTCLRHWRFYYDPPEFMTVLASTEKNSQFHFGYYRDDPKEMPIFVATNNSSNNCTFTPVGPNLFSAVSAYIKNHLKEFKSKYNKTHLEEIRALKTKLDKWATDHNFTLDAKSAEIKARQKLVVSPTFHRAGIVVPVDKKTEVGYRPLPESDGKLKKLMQSIVDSQTEKERNENFDKLTEIVTLIQFANDECDYGMGLEFGIDLFCFGDPIFHSTILRLLPLAYDLLNRQEYSQIITAHLEDRKKTGNLSVLT